MTKKKKRLAHSDKGLERMLQMSSNRIWIFVEGLEDRAFYGALCEQRKLDRATNYALRLLQEVPFECSAGKPGLLELYKYLRSRNRLCSDLKGKRTAIVFLLDKDIDDIHRCRVRSDHVAYTEFFAIENYLFRMGDICKALAVGACLDHGVVSGFMTGAAHGWTAAAARNWQAWVECCLMVQRYLPEKLPNYRVTSRIHSGPYASLIPEQYDEFVKAMQERAGLSDTEFTRRRAEIHDYVQRVFMRHKHDSIFNGKWYRKFLVHDASRIARLCGLRIRTQNLEQAIETCLLHTIDFSGEWAARYHRILDMACCLVG